MLGFIQFVVGGVLQGAIFGLLAVGFSLIYRVTTAVNLAQGGFCIFAALLTTSLEQQLGLPVVAAGVLAVALTAALALLLGITVFVPGLKRLPVSAMFILGAGLLTFLEGSAFVVWGSQSYTLPAFSGERPITLGGVLLPPQGLWLVGLMAVFTLALGVTLSATRLGRAFRACAENPFAASLVGIGVARMQLLSFVLAASTTPAAPDYTEARCWTTAIIAPGACYRRVHGIMATGRPLAPRATDPSDARPTSRSDTHRSGPPS